MPGEEEHKVGTSAALLNTRNNAPMERKPGSNPPPPSSSTLTGDGPVPTPPPPPLTAPRPAALPSPPPTILPPPPPSLTAPKIRLNSKSPESDEIVDHREPQVTTLLANHPKLPPHFRGLEEDDDDYEEDDPVVCRMAPNADGEDSSVGSRLEMELQFAGVDIENAELDAEENTEDGFPSGDIPRIPPPDSTIVGEEDKPPEKPKDPGPPIQTLAEKVLFYTTATFILLAIFSLFLFLFLVPFVIDPAFSTIFMEFDPAPALCVTESVVNLTGQTNCTWTSCKEGCTREVFSCTQVRVSYWVGAGGGGAASGAHHSPEGSGPRWGEDGAGARPSGTKNNYYNYHVGDGMERGPGTTNHKIKKHKGTGVEPRGVGRGPPTPAPPSATTAPGEARMFKNAHLFPNVKGCGYPPVVNCTVFYNQYAVVGRNFSCFYSKVNPSLVITVFDMNRVILELALSMAIPIPCFIISVVYLVFAYFRIYNQGPPGSPSATTHPIPSVTNNNVGGGGGGGGGSEPDPETSLSTTDEKTRIIQRSTSHGLNAVDKLTDRLMPNSGKGLLAHAQVMEMNDLTPMILTPADGDFILPSRNNRAPERNGPTINPAAKNKGEMNGHNCGQVLDAPGAAKYLEPGFLPERINSLPPIEISHSRNALTTISQVRDSRSIASLTSIPEDGTKL